MHRLGAAAQQHGVARPHTQRRRIGGDVRAAFINDADYPDRDAHTFQHHAIGPGRPFDYRAGGVGQHRDIGDRCRHRLQPLRVEPQPVEQRPGQAIGLARGHVAGIGGQHLRRGAAQGVGRQFQRVFARRRRHTRQHGLCRTSVARQLVYKIGNAGRTGFSRMIKGSSHVRRSITPPHSCQPPRVAARIEPVANPINQHRYLFHAIRFGWPLIRHGPPIPSHCASAPTPPRA